ncbi:hypothetical protein [Echinimonas agarilytica]|uniref:MSHA pilin protein MshC n=1 Tax=Echinimonas agarilytica TaxID=1215918 RepID=A0AA41W4I4_9GAMM|nr:hypothetical protein [Echinimonas agarilytica]MCM2678588.1 hypothetical protein [Echinimonas agarilytica]
MRHAFKQRQSSGFTVIELVVIIIILGIISITVIPRFMSSQGFAEVAMRDELVERLRSVQLSAMSSVSGECHMLVVTPSFFGVSQRDTGSCPSTYLDNVTSFVSVTSSLKNISFDRLGRPQDDCAGGCDVIITGSTTESLRIESEGFIHAL